MIHFHLRRLTPAALFAAGCAVTVTALATPPAARPDPLDPQAKVPALKYGSSLSAPRRLPDDKATSWREANDSVARIGGWRVYAREAQQAEPGSTVPASPAPAGEAKPAPHHDHGGHKKP